MITIRFAGWISGRIVSLQPDKDIQKLLSNWNRIRISEMLLSMFWGFRLLEKVAHCTITFIYYLQKHLFSLLRPDSESVNGVTSEVNRRVIPSLLTWICSWCGKIIGLFQCALRQGCEVGSFGTKFRKFCSQITVTGRKIFIWPFGSFLALFQDRLDPCKN